MYGCFFPLQLHRGGTSFCCNCNLSRRRLAATQPAAIELPWREAAAAGQQQQQQVAAGPADMLTDGPADEPADTGGGADAAGDVARPGVRLVWLSNTVHAIKYGLPSNTKALTASGHGSKVQSTHQTRTALQHDGP